MLTKIFSKLLNKNTMEKEKEQVAPSAPALEIVEVTQSTPTTSPLPVKRVEEVSRFLDFYEAVKQVMEGKKIRREEWDEKDYYGFLNDGILSLHKTDGTLHHWIISDGDINGTDWVVL